MLPSWTSRRNARVVVVSMIFVSCFLYENIVIIGTGGGRAPMNDGSDDDDIDDVYGGAPEASLPEHHAPLEWDLPQDIPENYTEGVYFDAVDTRGRRGYVADPTLLRRLVLRWHRRRGENATYWDRIRDYSSHLLLANGSVDSLTMEKVCSLTEHTGGGQELNDGGVTMITSRVKVDAESPVLRRGCTESPPLGDERPRLFCGVYTHDARRDFARLSALSYGWKCDGYLSFGTATVPRLGMVGLLHNGREAYQNMVQKSRSIWSYVATHYLDDYDYFHVGGDDMHLIVENMRSLLLEHEVQRDESSGRIFGQLVSKGVPNRFLRGGPGYTMDRLGLKKLHDNMSNCAPRVYGSWEDNAMTLCARKVGLEFSDNVDDCTGQQRSHTANPGMLYNADGRSESILDEYLRFWATLPHRGCRDSIPGRRWD